VLASAPIACYPYSRLKVQVFASLNKAGMHCRDVYEEQAVSEAWLQITAVGRIVEMWFPGLRISGHLPNSQRAQATAPACKEQRLLETSAKFVRNKQ
jgi:hypothetical protein